MRSYQNKHGTKSDKWTPTKQAGVACGRCGKSGTCTVSPDGTAFKCWKNNGEIYRSDSSNRSREPIKNRAFLASRWPRFSTAEDAIAAAGKSIKGGIPTKIWTYPGDTARVVRFDCPDGSKEFRPLYRDGVRWSISDPPGLWSLYLGDGVEELPEPGKTVYVVEGEKCCDIARSLGMNAVTSSHGSASASKSDWSKLSKHEGEIILIPDNDDAGEKYVMDVARIIFSENSKAQIKIVRLPDLPPGGDIEQFKAAGGRRVKIKEFARSERFLEPHAVLGGPVLTRMADVVPTEIDWLWPGRIPLGRITLLVGQPGIGKSFLTCDITARVTTGADWPDKEKCRTGSVILICGEDDPGDTIRPRLDAHNANVQNVTLLDKVRIIGDDGKFYEVPFILAHLPQLETALKTHSDCKLIVIDPIGSFIGGKTDTDKDNAVRAVLAPIAELARKYNVAVLIVAHRRKAQGSSADDLAMGSKAFTALSRAVIHLCSDPDNRDRRLMLSGKSNLAPMGNGLAFTIPATETGVPAIEWESEPVNMTANDALAKENAGEGPGRPATERNEARKWLEEKLADGNEHPVKELQKSAEEESKLFSWRSVRRAASEIPVEKRRPGFGGGLFWKLPTQNMNGHSGQTASNK